MSFADIVFKDTENISYNPPTLFPSNTYKSAFQIRKRQPVCSIFQSVTFQALQILAYSQPNRDQLSLSPFLASLPTKATSLDDAQGLPLSHILQIIAQGNICVSITRCSSLVYSFTNSKTKK